ncbi:hypothetical protein EDD86DRAFT_126734 [Gorgonomyces haynaldii]|nr:hypothetical protein EDD86DRAFT_126734 [Gorgonomyces haynaldii]
MENLTIADLKPGQKNLAMQVIVIDKKIDSSMRDMMFLVGDVSGCVILMLQGQMYSKLEPGDCLMLRNASAILKDDRLVLWMDRDTGKLTRFAEDMIAYVPKPIISHFLWVQQDNDWVKGKLCKTDQWVI